MALDSKPTEIKDITQSGVQSQEWKRKKGALLRSAVLFSLVCVHPYQQREAS